MGIDGRQRDRIIRPARFGQRQFRADAFGLEQFSKSLAAEIPDTVDVGERVGGDGDEPETALLGAPVATYD